MQFKSTILAALSACIAMSACQSTSDSSNDPKKRLNEYVSQSFAVKTPQDRKELLPYLTGEARSRLESWSDDQFRQAFIDTKRQFLKLAFKEFKSAGADEANLTYEITFQSSYQESGAPQGSPAQDAKVTSRKLAHMVRKDGNWLIDEVRNVRELVEYKHELSLTPSGG
jgi:hypothetical protein